MSRKQCRKLPTWETRSGEWHVLLGASHLHQPSRTVGVIPTAMQSVRGRHGFLGHRTRLTQRRLRRQGDVDAAAYRCSTLDTERVARRTDAYHLPCVIAVLNVSHGRAPCWPQFRLTDADGAPSVSQRRTHHGMLPCTMWCERP